jgi:hypothetical protein
MKSTHPRDGSQNEATQLAWAAGFVDGEGCIHIAKTNFPCGRRSTYRLRLTLAQNCIETLWHFQDVLPVHGGLHKINRLAAHNKQCYLLSYDGKQAREAIEALLPYLVRKRAEALAALAFYEDGRVGWYPGRNGVPEELWRTRERYYRKLRSLK